MELMLAILSLVTGTWAFWGSRRPFRTAFTHRHDGLDMYMEMAWPFSEAIAVESLTGSKALSVVIVTVGTSILLVWSRQVLWMTEWMAGTLSALMSAGMAVMMLGMVDASVVDVMLLLLSGIAVMMIFTQRVGGRRIKPWPQGKRDRGSS